jgi:hypothetical protein
VPVYSNCISNQQPTNVSRHIGSHGELLGTLRSISLGYVNVESTIKPKVDQIQILHPDFCELNIDPHLRFIVLENQVRNNPELLKEEFGIQSSAYECGRVLEANDYVVIDDIPLVVTIKGCGATNFFRQTGAITKYLTYIETRDAKHDPNQFSEQPYLGRSGLLDLGIMNRELAGATIVDSIGIPTQKNIATARLTHIPDKNGIFTSIEDLQKQGIIDNDIQPMILVRAARSNFRLMDFVNLSDQKDYEGLKWLIAHAKKLHAKELGNNPSDQKLFNFLMNQVSESILKICFAGFTTNVHYCDDLARNITIASEFIDLDDLAKTSINPGSISSNFASHIRLLMKINKLLAQSFSSVSEKNISTYHVTTECIRLLLNGLKSGKVDHLYQGLSDSRKSEVSLKVFKYDIFESSVSYFFDYTFYGEFSKQTNRTYASVRKYLAKLGYKK